MKKPNNLTIAAQNTKKKSKNKIKFQYEEKDYRLTKFNIMIYKTTTATEGAMEFRKPQNQKNTLRH